MRKWFFTFIAISLLFAPMVGRAQAEVSLAALEVKLWPEYDAPEMLVIYTFDLPASTILPAEVSFRIPAAAGQAYGYGYYPEGGGVPVQENYQQRADGGWLVVSFTMRSLTGTLEYYDPALIKTGKARHFDYIWAGGYAVDAMTFLFQQPVGAHDVRLTPAAKATSTGQNGLINHLVEAGRLAADTTYTLALDYQKDTNALSVADMPVEPLSPVSENTSSSWKPWVGVLLAIVGIALVVGAVVWYRFSLQRSTSAAPRRRKRSGTPAASQEAPSPANAGGAGEGVYCHQCGRRAGAGDRFCRSCGTQLRVD
jgi:hypothetical protein